MIMPAWIKPLIWSIAFALSLPSTAQNECLEWRWRNPLPGGDRLNDLVWNGELFVAVGVRGVILVSHDGKQWRPVPSGTLEEMNRVVWDGDDFVIVGNNGLVLQSEDAMTWTPLNTGYDYNYYDAIKTKDGRIVVGERLAVLVTRDGETWERYFGLTNSSTDRFTGIAWNGSRYVAVGPDGGVSLGLTYKDWLPKTAPVAHNLNHVIDTGSNFIAVGESGTILRSHDGNAWSSVEHPIGFDLNRVALIDDKLLIVGDSGRYAIGSDDAWRADQIAPGLDLMGVATGDRDHVIVGDAGSIYTSTDGHVWNYRLPGLTGRRPIEGILKNGENYMAVGNGFILSSANGLSWEKTPTGLDLHDIAWDDGFYVIVGKNGTLRTSQDARTWTVRDATTDVNLYALATGFGRFVAVGENGVIRMSTNARDWERGSTALRKRLVEVIWADNEFVACGVEGSILTSPDGLRWSIETVPSKIDNVTGVAWSGQRYVAVTDRGAVWTSEDGDLWEAVTLRDITASAFYAVAWNGEYFLALNKGRAFTSRDGLNWIATEIEVETEIRELFWNGTWFTGFGPTGSIITGACHRLGDPYPAPIEIRSLLYPWISNSDRFESILVVNNFGKQTAKVSLTARRSNGEREETGPIAIAPRGFLKRFASDLFPRLGNGAGYSVALKSDTATVTGAWVTNNLNTPSGGSPSLGVAVAVPRPENPPSPRAGHNLLVGYLPVTDGMISGPVIVNAGNGPTDVHLSFYNQSGVRLETTQPVIKDLEPYRPVAGLANELVSAANGDVYMMANSTVEPITGVGFLFNEVGEPGIGNASAVDQVVAGHRFFFPWVSNSSIFESILVVNNMGEERAELTLTAARAGGPTETHVATIPPHGFFRGFASDIFPGLGSGPGYTVTLDTTGSWVHGRWQTNNLLTASGRSPSQVAGVALWENASDARAGRNILFGFLPVTGGFTAASVIVNLGPYESRVKLYLFDENGALVAQQRTENLPLNRPFATLINDLVPSGGGDVYLVAVAERLSSLTGAAFVFNDASETAIGNVSAIKFEPPE